MDVKISEIAKFQDLIGEMINPRLLTAVFSAIDYESLQNATSRRIPLAEVLSDDRELVADILSKGTEENAKDLAQALMLNPGFEDLTKDLCLHDLLRNSQKFNPCWIEKKVLIPLLHLVVQ